jgi:invasion protein IalB
MRLLVTSGLGFGAMALAVLAWGADGSAQGPEPPITLGEAAAPSQSAAITPWVRVCGDADSEGRKICSTGREVRLPERQLVASVTLFERTNDSAKVLRIVLPSSMQSAGRLPVSIDGEISSLAAHLGCGSKQCSFDLQIDPALFARLEHGHRLDIQATAKNGEVVALPLEITGLADARRGPAIDALQLKRQWLERLSRLRESMPVHDDRLIRCEGAVGAGPCAQLQFRGR